jgi:hypothetical protein
VLNECSSGNTRPFVIEGLGRFSIVTRLRAGRSEFSSTQKGKGFSFRLALDPIQPPFSLVHISRCDVDVAEQ